jgi:hypothetical protein
MTDNQSVRDRAAQVLRTSALAVWAHMPNGQVPTEHLHFLDNRVLRIEGSPEQLVDELANAGLLAGMAPDPVKPWLEPTWLILTELRRHRYDYGGKGTKPADPGWHVCACEAWEGYWCDYQPHVAEQVDTALAPRREAACHQNLPTA